MIGDEPAAGLDLIREVEALQALHAVDQNMPILAQQIGVRSARPQVDDALVPLLGDQYSVETGQSLRLDLARAFSRDLKFALMAEFQGDQFPRPIARKGAIKWTRLSCPVPSPPTPFAFNFML